MKAISYSIFSSGHKDSFPFRTYLRGLHINIRLNKLLYPDWVNVIETTTSTYNDFKPFFDFHTSKGAVIEFNEPSPLCEAMLWRLKPVFHTNKYQTWKYDHVICRDTDAIPTYREAQAVAKWIEEDTCIHSITDSASHTIPLMGGMIGIRPRYFSERMQSNSWVELMSNARYDFNRKGSDQDFLNDYCWPRVSRYESSSFTAHWIKGLTGSNSNRQYNYIQDLDIGIPQALKEINHACGHIGSAGYYDVTLLNFLKNHDSNSVFEDIEKQYPEIFYWHL